jgi:hypothetical protein
MMPREIVIYAAHARYWQAMTTVAALDALLGGDPTSNPALRRLRDRTLADAIGYASQCIDREALSRCSPMI